MACVQCWDDLYLHNACCPAHCTRASPHRKNPATIHTFRYHTLSDSYLYRLYITNIKQNYCYSVHCAHRCVGLYDSITCWPRIPARHRVISKNFCMNKISRNVDKIVWYYDGQETFGFCERRWSVCSKSRENPLWRALLGKPKEEEVL